MGNSAGHNRAHDCPGLRREEAGGRPGPLGDCRPVFWVHAHLRVVLDTYGTCIGCGAGVYFVVEPHLWQLGVDRLLKNAGSAGTL